MLRAIVSHGRRPCETCSCVACPAAGDQWSFTAALSRLQKFA